MSISAKSVTFRRLAAALAAAALLAACTPNQNGGTAAGGTAGTGGTTGIAGAATPGSVQEFTVTVGDRVYFELNSSTLTPEARLILDRQAQWLLIYPTYRIVVEGHADERGTREYNLALGSRRAQAVYNYLVARGVNPNRISTTSFGKERPVALCNAESCWSQNRRAVTVLTST